MGREMYKFIMVRKGIRQEHSKTKCASGEQKKDQFILNTILILHIHNIDQGKTKSMPNIFVLKNINLVVAGPGTEEIKSSTGKESAGENC